MMMSEQRYGVHYCPNGFYYLRDVTDHSVYIHRDYGYLYSPYKEDIELVSTLLNELADKVDEQQDTIFKLQDLCGKSDGENAKLRIENKRLQEENEQLRQMIKENVFQRYREGSLADLEFKAIAYDDIIKVKLSDESESKVIVICKQGKKENVKSFCQMFIPFGVYYEIKEGDDEIGRV